MDPSTSSEDTWGPPNSTLLSALLGSRILGSIGQVHFFFVGWTSKEIILYHRPSGCQMDGSQGAINEPLKGLNTTHWRVLVSKWYISGVYGLYNIYSLHVYRHIFLETSPIPNLSLPKRNGVLSKMFVRPAFPHPKKFFLVVLTGILGVLFSNPPKKFGEDVGLPQLYAFVSTFVSDNSGRFFPKKLNLEVKRTIKQVVYPAIVDEVNPY